MIRVIKGPSPAELEKPNCRQKVEENVRNKAFDGAYYNCLPVYEALVVATYNKCCFCESPLAPIVTKLQVEHFRPKKKCRLKGEQIHEGYYWLGHEWANLLLACGACNIAKSTRFPIQGLRVSDPSLKSDKTLDRSQCALDKPPLSDEAPMLINPEYEDPEPYFWFHPDGTISSKIVRGQKSISVCNLNRKSLIDKRKSVIDEYLEELRVHFTAFTINMINEKQLRYYLSQLVKKIKSECAPQQAYTLFRKQCFLRYEEFFVAQVEDSQKILVRQAFKASM